MKIGISLLGLEPGNMGGIEFYAKQLIKFLQNIDRDNTYFVFIENENHIERLTAPNFQTVILKPNVLDKIKNRGMRLVDNESNIYTLLIKNKGCDIVHFPLQVINIPGLRSKKIISVMDLQHEHFPQYFSKVDLESRKKLFGSSIKQADHIISISKFTKDDIVKRHQVPAKKISVVHLAPNLPKRSSPPLRFKLPNIYFYYPAASWPHKNHLRLLEAFEQFHTIHPDYHMVFSGAFKSSHQEIIKFIEDHSLSDKVHNLGFLKDEEVRFLYENASGLIFPSLFEGFGMPVIEAMYLGCPVACSNLKVLNEIAGNFAVYFNPREVSDILGALLSLAGKKKNDKQLDRARVHSAEFSFISTAEETLKIYDQVSSQR